MKSIFIHWLFYWFLKWLEAGKGAHMKCVHKHIKRCLKGDRHSLSRSPPIKSNGTIFRRESVVGRTWFRQYFNSFLKILFIMYIIYKTESIVFNSSTTYRIHSNVKVKLLCITKLCCSQCILNQIVVGIWQDQCN